MDDDDRYIARQIYLKKFEDNLNILAEVGREKPKMYDLTEMNVSETSETEFKSVQILIPTVRLRIPYPFSGHHSDSSPGFNW